MTRSRATLVYPCYHRIIGPSRLEQTCRIPTQPTPPVTVCLSATSLCSGNTPRDGGPPPLGSCASTRLLFGEEITPNIQVLVYAGFVRFYVRIVMHLYYYILLTSFIACLHFLYAFIPLCRGSGLSSFVLLKECCVTCLHCSKVLGLTKQAAWCPSCCHTQPFDKEQPTEMHPAAWRVYSCKWN